MPHLTLNTTIDFEDAKVEEILVTFTKAISKLLGKPEKFVMVQVNKGQKMSFGGSTDPCAVIRLVSIGGLDDKDKNNEIVADLSQIVVELGVSADRCFVELANAERHQYGFNGKTFAQ